MNTVNTIDTPNTADTHNTADTAVICCRTLEEELRMAMKETKVDYPVIWLESGLHNTPDKLHRRLEEEIGKLAPGRVLMAMGFCGNSMAGLGAGESELILPRADDCISLLMGSVARRVAVSQEYSAYFLTEGWMRGERNLWVEYQHSVEKYGEEEAKEIAEMMYAHYRTLALLDTGASSIDSLLESTKEIAETLDLSQQVVPATLSWIKQLLTGPWDSDRFIIVPPGGVISVEEMIVS